MLTAAFFPVTVGGIKATEQHFAAVTSESPNFAQDPIDGVLGLAFPSISRLRQVSAKTESEQPVAFSRHV